VGAWDGLLVGLNDGVAVVGSEVGSPSFTVGLCLGFTGERGKWQYDKYD
jgi:hypothetical protein